MNSVMSSHFVRIGLPRVGLVSSLCMLLAAGCSSDASLGGQHKEQDADEHDAGDGGSSSGAEQSASTGSYSTASDSAGSVQTASASNVDGTGGSGTSAGGAAAGGSVSVGGSGAGGDNATSGGSSGDGSTTDGDTTGGAGGGTGSSGGSGETTSAGGAACEMYQCARPFECVESCGGPILKSSCCFCDPGTFDQIQCPIADCASSADCESDEYCYFEGETCGEDGILGTCRGHLLFCPAIITPTCGCDLVLYESECSAAYAGVSVTALERCSED